MITEEEPPITIEEIIVSANPEFNVPGGTSKVEALVLNSVGKPVDNGTIVFFKTNSGSLSQSSAATTNGIAEVNLTLDNNMVSGEKAKVTAFIGAKNGSIDITCIDVIITIYADTLQIPISGGSATITAVVTTTEGKAKEDLVVTFFTNRGSFNPVYCPTNSYGIAQSILTIPSGSSPTIEIYARCGSRKSNVIEITQQ